MCTKKAECLLMLLFDTDHMHQNNTHIHSTFAQENTGKMKSSLKSASEYIRLTESKPLPLSEKIEYINKKYYGRVAVK